MREENIQLFRKMSTFLFVIFMTTLIVGFVLESTTTCGHDHEGIAAIESFKSPASDDSSATSMKHQNEIAFSISPQRKKGEWDAKVSFHSVNTAVFAVAKEPRLSYFMEKVDPGSPFIEFQFQFDGEWKTMMLYFQKEKYQNPQFWMFPVPSNSIRVRLRKDFFTDGASCTFSMDSRTRRDYEFTFEREGETIRHLK